MRWAYIRRKALVSGEGQLDKDLIFGTESALTGEIPVELAFEISWPFSARSIVRGYVGDPDAFLNQKFATEIKNRLGYFPPQPWDEQTPYVVVAGREIRVRWLAGVPGPLLPSPGPPWAKHIIDFFLDRATLVESPGMGGGAYVWPMEHVTSWRFGPYTRVPLAFMFLGVFTPAVTQNLARHYLPILKAMVIPGGRRNEH